MKRFMAALALVCVFAVSSLAGDIPSGGVPAPAPPCVDCVTMSEPSPGDIPSGGIALIASEGLLDLVGALSSLAF
jgi:hypothetical protein